MAKKLDQSFALDRLVTGGGFGRTIGDKENWQLVHQRIKEGRIEEVSTRGTRAGESSGLGWSLQKLR